MVVIVAVMVLASVGFAALLGRPRHDSIAEHQRAIDTLRDIAEHAHDDPELVVHNEPDRTDHVQLFSEPPDGRVRRARSSTRSGPMASSARRPRPDYSSRPTVANLPTIGAAAQPGKLLASSLPQPGGDGSRTDPAPEPPSTTIEARQFVDASKNRFGPTRRTLAGVAVLAAIAASAVAATHISGSSHHHLRNPPAAFAPRRTSTSRTSPSRPSSTTTTRRSVLQAVLTSGGNANLDVTFPVTLTLRATQPCWVLASSQAGPTLYTGTLQAGQQQQLSVSAPFALRLGNSAGIALFVNDLPVSLAGVANTATLTFAGA